MWMNESIVNETKSDMAEDLDGNKRPLCVLQSSMLKSHQVAQYCQKNNS